jgi:hypothetical protein
MKIDIENVLTLKFGSTFPPWTAPFLRAVEMLDNLAKKEAGTSPSDEEVITLNDLMRQYRKRPQEKPPRVPTFEDIEAELQTVSDRCLPRMKMLIHALRIRPLSAVTGNKRCRSHGSPVSI